jgi:HK97 family phage portal protein
MFDFLRREAKASPARRLVALHYGRDPVWTSADPSAGVRAFSANAVAHRCVKLIAEGAAAAEWRASAPAARALLQAANPDQSGAELFEALFGHLLLTGNAYLELVEIEGAPRELHVLRPDRMRVLPGPRGWPDGWEYSVGGRKARYLRDRASGRSPILHMRLFHPEDDHYGLSPLRAAGSAVDLHAAAGGWAKALLDNAARPSGALIFSGGEGARLSDEQFERLRAELAEAHSGVANAGRPLLLEGGLDWKPMALSPADMDFIEARREAAREIALALGVPPLLLGLPGDNTYANYREANLAFARSTLSPLIAKTARALIGWLRPWFGEGLTVEAALAPDSLVSEEAA